MLGAVSPRAVVKEEPTKLSDVKLTETKVERVQSNMIPKFQPWEGGRWKDNQQKRRPLWFGEDIEGNGFQSIAFVGTLGLPSSDVL